MSLDSKTEQELDRAIEQDRFDVVRRLLDSGLDPNEAITAAATGGNAKILQQLLASQPLDSLDLDDLLIHICSLRKKVEIAKLLIEAGANPNAFDSDRHETPLSWVVEESDDVEMVRYLLEAGADPNFDGTLDPLLFTACAQNHTKCAHALIDAGAFVNATDYLGWAPITMAIHDAGVVQHLLDAGADPKKSAKSPLEWARSTPDADPKVFAILEKAEGAS